MKATAFLAALVSAALAAPLSAATEAEAALGREIVKKNADSIVAVELVVNSGSGRGGGGRGGSGEQKVEVNATVISPTGLTVTSLAAIDPRVGRGRGSSDNSDSEFKEVKLRLADNTEIPAMVVLKDAELDLAFIAPIAGTGPAKTYPYLNLEDAGKAEVLGTYFDMTRLPKNMQRTPVIQVVSVLAMIEKPRKLILTTDQTLGCPVFDMKGKPLGIALAYLSNNTAIQIVVVPAEDIIDMAKQAAAVKTVPMPMGPVDVAK
jgi:S1-C subfamily serine protease